MPDEQDVIRILYEIEQRFNDRHERCCKKILDAISASNASILSAISALAPPAEATVAKFTLLSGGIPMGAPVTVQVGLSGGTSTFVESSAAGVVVPAIGPVTYASDNPAVATIDPNLGTWVPVSAGTANLSALDTGNGLTDTVALTVTAAAPPVATSAVFTLIPNATKRR